MSWTDLGSLGVNGSSGNNQASLAVTTTQACNVGDLVVLVHAVDNRLATAPSDAGEAASVTDNAVGGPNVWTKAVGWSYGGATPATQGGAAVSIWYSVLTVAMPTGRTITVTHTSSSLSDATGMTAWRFRADNPIEVAATNVGVASAADPPSLDAVTANKEHLRVRGIAAEVGNNTNLTPTTNWTAWGNGNSATTGTIAEMCARAEHRVSTGTGDASNPTYVACDNASAYAAFVELTERTLVASDLAVGVITIDQGTLNQHQLVFAAPDNFATGAPTIEAAVFQEETANKNLGTPPQLAVAAPTIDQSTIAQGHSLIADLAPVSPTLGHGILGQHHTLALPISLAVSAPTFPIPVLVQTVPIAPNGFVIAAPTILAATMDLDLPVVVLGDRVLDAGLQVLRDEADEIWICLAHPNSYAEAISYKLGDTPSTFGNPDTVAGGRRIVHPAITDGNVTAIGDAHRWAVIDTINSRLLATGDLSGDLRTINGSTWTLDAIAIVQPR